MGTSVLWLRASCSIYHSIFDSCKSERVLFVAVIIVSQLILSMWWVFVAVVGVFISVCCFWCYGVPEIASTLTTKLVSSQPQKWHAIAIRMNDLSFQLDLMYIPCSIVQFSRYERQCRTDIICWEKARRRKNELNTIKTWFVSFSLASAT